MNILKIFSFYFSVYFRKLHLFAFPLKLYTTVFAFKILFIIADLTDDSCNWQFHLLLSLVVLLNMFFSFPLFSVCELHGWVFNSFHVFMMVKDRESWRATVHAVTTNCTRLSNWTATNDPNIFASQIAMWVSIFIIYNWSIVDLQYCVNFRYSKMIQLHIYI